MAAAKNGEDARSRILAAACEIFGAKGFRAATHAEICRRSQVNTAAINYYFRSKKMLYVEAWRTALEKSLAAHPADGGVPPDAPAAERLAGRISSIIARISDPAGNEFEIIHREMVNPTGLLGGAMRESLNPLRRELGNIIRELAGPLVSDEQINLCGMSIMAQCFHPVMRKQRLRITDNQDELPKFNIDTLTRHIIAFSLAGIKEVRRLAEQDGSK